MCVSSYNGARKRHPKGVVLVFSKNSFRKWQHPVGTIRSPWNLQWRRPNKQPLFEGLNWRFAQWDPQKVVPYLAVFNVIKKRSDRNVTGKIVKKVNVQKQKYFIIMPRIPINMNEFMRFLKLRTLTLHPISSVDKAVRNIFKAHLCLCVIEQAEGP